MSTRKKRRVLRNRMEDISEALYIATLINPRDHKPYVLVWNREHKGVHVTSPATFEGGQYEVLGVGTYEAYGNYGGEYKISEEVTGCPRTHTAKGVAEKGEGLGLMLYCGLALGVALAVGMFSEKRQKWKLTALYDSLTASEPCISSQEGTRSESSERWWASQKSTEYKRKYPHTAGLVREVEGEGGEECDDMDIEREVEGDTYVDNREARDEVASDKGVDRQDVEIKGISGTLSGTLTISYCISGQEGTFDVMDAEAVTDSPMVIDANSDVRSWDDKLESYDKRGVSLDMMEEIDLIGITNRPFLKLIENIFVRLGATGADYLKWRREKLPFWVKDVPGTVPAALANRKAHKNAVEHSAEWLRVFGPYMEL